jgi:hypothetical protein
VRGEFTPARSLGQGDAAGLTATEYSLEVSQRLAGIMMGNDNAPLILSARRHIKTHHFASIEFVFRLDYAKLA